MTNADLVQPLVQRRTQAPRDPDDWTSGRG